MKNFKVVLALIALFVASISFEASAQKKRPENTSSAKAYYGYKTKSTYKAKRNKKKIKNYTHSTPASGTRSDAWSTRKKYNKIYADRS